MRLCAAIANTAWALLVLAASAGGCSTGGAVPAASVSIGLMAPLTGDLAGLGKDLLDAANLAVDEINAGGGIRGRRAQLVVRDDAATELGGERALSSLYAFGVPIIIGPTTSAQVERLAPILTQRQILSIAPAASSASLTGISPYFVRLAPSDVAQALLLSQLILEDKVQQICIIHRSDAYGLPLANALAANLKSSPIKVVLSPYDAVPRFQAAVDVCKSVCDLDKQGKCKPDRTRALALISFVGDGAALSDIAFQSAGWSASTHRWYASEGFRDPNLPQLTRFPAALEGVRGSAPSGPPPESVPGQTYRAFAARFRDRFGRDAPGYTEVAYDATYLAALTLLIGSPEDPKALRSVLPRLAEKGKKEVGPGDWAKALATVAASGGHIDFRGASGEVDINSDGDVSPPYFYTVYEFRAGVFITSEIRQVGAP
jgi:ABC-type branched-subunit amino acid transport system substrate-binding protein